MKRLIAVLLLLTSCGNGMDDRIVAASARFVGVPYAESPLGEGEGSIPDSDPLYRFDAFDCMTYVETVLALAETDGDEEFRQAMNGIRYKDGEVSFLSRNHFTSVDWIPNNSRYVADATGKVSENALGRPAVLSRVRIDKQKWFENAHDLIVSVAPVESGLDYIAIDDLLANRESFARQIRSPMIANVVVKYSRLQKKIGTDTDIAHTGFLLPVEGGLVFRHASKRAGSVGDADFFEYLEFLKGYPEYKGVNLLEIRDAR